MLIYQIYSLAFDFQDEIHYHFSGIFGPAEAHQKRQELKAATCEKNGITLISVSLLELEIITNSRVNNTVIDTILG